jgi:transport family protein 27
MSNVLRSKLVVVGDWAAGKSAIIHQFINSGTAFPKNYSMTLGGEVITRLVNIPDSTDAVELVIIDCSGRTIYSDILTKAWDGTALILAVFDVTREESLVAAKTWVEHVKQSSEAKTFPGVLLANKSDLTERRVVPPKIGLDMATQLQLQYFECSAKDHTGVEETFFYLANEWHKLHAEQASNMAQMA